MISDMIHFWFTWMSVAVVILCIFFLFRNNWVYRQWLKLIDEDFMVYMTLPSYESMLFGRGFWVWDINYFISLEDAAGKPACGEIVIKYCETCTNWSEISPYRGLRFCKCSKLTEPAGEEAFTSDSLTYSYNEDGAFRTGPKFGCVHHKEPL